MPRVTVLMAVYNGERFLREAIESVLNQTYRDFEFLIVDDGSTDRSQEILAAYDDRRIKLFVNDRNRGMAAALNRGLQEASGEFIARQDADDRSHPSRLQRQVDVMRAHPEIVLLGTQANRINSAGARLGIIVRPREPLSIQWFHLFDNPFIHTSVLFNRALFLKEGWHYNENLPYIEDYDLWSRVLHKYRTLNLSDRLVDYRSHETSWTGPSQQGIPVRQRSQDYIGLLDSLVRENYSQTFGGVYEQEEAALIVGFLSGLGAPTLSAFLEIFRRLLMRYVMLFPDVWESRDFRETVAFQYEAVATRLTPPSRRRALEVYRAALSHDPSLIEHLSWPRFLGLVVLGRSGLAHLKSLRNSWRAVSA